MKINRVKISNILGIEELEFKGGAFIQIEGPNGSGKTSALEAIKAAIRGGKDATLVRNGAEKGEVVIELDNGSILSRRFTEKGAYLTLTKADGSVAKTQSEIDALVDMLSVNPVEFLAAKPEKRVDVLLEALPMEVDPNRIRKILGDDAYEVRPGGALAQIDAAYDSVYGDRRETNRAIREKEDSINQLRQTLPRDSSGGVLDAADGEESYQLRVDNIDREKDAEIERISAKLAGLRREHEGELQVIRDQIAELQAQITAKVEAFAETERRAGVQRERTISRWQEQRAPVMESLNAIRQNREMMTRAKTTNETIATFEKQLAGLRETKDRQEAALDNLKAYKAELMAALPIDGLEIRDGQIYRNDVVFDRLNTQQQVEIAVEVAKLRAKEWGIICVDGLESLDTAHFEAFRERAVESGFQLITTRVSDAEFNVKTQA